MQATPYNPQYDHLPRVSQIIKETQSQSKKNAIGKWRAEVGKEEAERITETAIQRGNQFHEQVERYSQDNNKNAYPSIHDFITQNEIEIIFVEGYVYNEEVGYKGRTDMLYKRNGVYGVLDWKTSYRRKPKNFFPDPKIQVSAYACGLEKMYQIEIHEAMVVVAIPQMKSHSPFEPLKELWDFQVEKIEKKNIKRCFNRFVKKVFLFHHPPPIVKKPKRIKLQTIIPTSKNPFEPICF